MSEQSLRLRRASSGSEEHVALVLRMLAHPSWPIVEVRKDRAARVHARGSLDGPQRYRSPLNREPLW